MNIGRHQPLQQYYCNLFGLLWHTIMIDRLQFQPTWPKEIHNLEPQIQATFLSFDGATRKNTSAWLSEYAALAEVTHSHWSEALNVLEVKKAVKAAGETQQS